MKMLQLRMSKHVVQMLLAPGDEEGSLADPIFHTLAADPGLEQSVPYLVAHIASEVASSKHSLVKLSRLLHAAHALILNRTNNLGAYLPQLLPALLTCLLSAKLGTPSAPSSFYASACPPASHVAVVHEIGAASQSLERFTAG